MKELHIFVKVAEWINITLNSSNMVSTLVYITYNYINLQAFIQFLITSNYKLFNIINLDMRYDQNFSQCSSIYWGTTFQLKKNAAMFLMIVSIFMSLSYSSYQIVCLTISQTTRYQIINQNTCTRIIIKWNYFYECSNQNKICLLLYPFSNLVEHACNFKQRHFNNKLVILMTFFHF